jgi:hypothetical protein
MPLWLIALLVLAVIIVLVVLARRRRRARDRWLAEFGSAPSTTDVERHVDPWPPMPPRVHAVREDEDLIVLGLPLALDVPPERDEHRSTHQPEPSGGSFGGAGASGGWDDDDTKRALAAEPAAAVDVSADVCSVEPASEPSSSSYEDAGASYSSDTSYDSGSSADSCSWDSGSSSSDFGSNDP